MNRPTWEYWQIWHHFKNDQTNAENNMFHPFKSHELVYQLNTVQSEINMCVTTGTVPPTSIISNRSFLSGDTTYADKPVNLLNTTLMRCRITDIREVTITSRHDRWQNNRHLCDRWMSLWCSHHQAQTTMISRDDTKHWCHTVRIRCQFWQHFCWHKDIIFPIIPIETERMSLPGCGFTCTLQNDSWICYIGLTFTL